MNLLYEVLWLNAVNSLFPLWEVTAGSKGNKPVPMPMHTYSNQHAPVFSFNWVKQMIVAWLVYNKQQQPLTYISVNKNMKG